MTTTDAPPRRVDEKEPSDVQVLSEIQARVLACLVEKKETTPDQYPLTTNSLRLACNQKTARFPVTNYTEGEVGHAVRELIDLELAREAWGARTAKYEHELGKALGLSGKGLALLCPLMLRGPQTPGELKINAQRLHAFEDTEDVLHMLERMAEHDPPLVLRLGRQPGQKEDRYAHLLCGEPDSTTAVNPDPPAAARNSLEQRITLLEDQLHSIEQRLRDLEGRAADA